MKRPSVAAIIPAYNEADTIADVVRPLAASPFVDEVIVVSDGSTDGTEHVARAAGARVERLAKRRGKGEAMRLGASRAQAQVLAFFDADLIGLTPEHVERILMPVIVGGRAMNIGIRDRGVFFTWLSHHLPLISGERAMRRDIFEAIPQEYLHGFMVESSLNFYCRSRRLRYGATDLSGLYIRRKFQKVPFARAMVQYVGMFWQVGIAMLAVRLARLFGRF
ncbi:glycosyltransferase family 2 protein [Candidatus Parcubacteria bacterium]|nr:glycosyltransferase family 2 protein [Candidatus Parcubacteria bacterium]